MPGIPRSGRGPAAFAGMKLLFPFVRELSVLRVGRDIGRLSEWIGWAFLAGHDVGRAHPERLEDVLPGSEVREASIRVSVAL
jgi:hypothetical protein